MTAPTWSSRATTFCPDVLHLDHDRGVPQPAGRLGEGTAVGSRPSPSASRRPSTSRPGSARVECVNVEHEEVLLIPRWVDAGRVTFKYGLGDEFIGVLKTMHQLGLDSTSPVRVGGVEVSPRDVVAACLPDPAPTGRPDVRGDLCRHLGHRDGQGRRPGEVYLHHVVDNEWCMSRVRLAGRGVADGRQPDRRSGAARGRRAGPGRACSARRRSQPNRSSTCSTSTAPPWGCDERTPSGMRTSRTIGLAAAPPPAPGRRHPDRRAHLMATDQRVFQNFIDGALVDADGRADLRPGGPGDRRGLRHGPPFGPEDVDGRSSAARARLRVRGPPPPRRSAAWPSYRFADALEARAEELVDIECRNTGKPRALTTAEEFPPTHRPDPLLRRRLPPARGPVGRRVHGRLHVVRPPRAGRGVRPDHARGTTR